MSLVSVVVPTHDRPAALRRAIASVLAQTHTDWELLVAGDGASPETDGLMASYDDPRIRYRNYPRQDYPADEYLRWCRLGTQASNLALDEARGEWLTGLGDDDELPPDALANLLGGATDVSYGRVEVVGHGLLGAFPPEEGKIGPAMWRRNDLRLDTDCTRPADWDLYARMIGAGMTFRMVPEITYRYYPARNVPDCEPLVCAVIPTRFHPPALEVLLATLRQDGVIPYVMESEHYGHRIYRMWNDGVAFARIEHPRCYVAVLNDDIIIQPGALPLLARTLRGHPEVGVVYPEWRGEPRAEPELVATTGVHHQGGMTGFAFMFRSAMRLPFDEAYHWWYGDNDFEERVREEGLTVCCAKGVPVRHALDGSASKVWSELEPLVEADRQLWAERHAR